MRHDRHRASIGRAVRAVVVATGEPAGRVCPVQGLIDWQKVWQKVAAAIHEVVDPLHPDWPIVPCLDGEGWIVPRSCRVRQREIAPYGRLFTGYDLLLKLLNGDFVVVGQLTTACANFISSRHRRRHDQIADILWDRGRIECRPIASIHVKQSPLISILAHATPAILFAKLDYAIGDAQGLCCKNLRGEDLRRRAEDRRS